MIINIIGDCDKRAVLYTVMKICQRLGDVALITSSSRLIRLSDTKADFGHYQNTMIAVTQDGIDDFWEQFRYGNDDFDFVIIDNIIDAEADVHIYCKGMVQSEDEENAIEYIENLNVIDLYKGRMLSGDTLYRCEEFEALRNMCVISPKIADVVANILAKPFNTTAKNLFKIATTETNTRKKH